MWFGRKGNRSIGAVSSFPNGHNDGTQKLSWVRKKDRIRLDAVFIHLVAFRFGLFAVAEELNAGGVTV